MFVSRRARLALLSGAFLASLAQAAEITRVASSFEDNKPFGMFVDIGFMRTQDRAKITREWYQSNSNQDVTELRYTMIDTRLNLDAHIGIWQDVEFHYQLPIVFQQDRTWNFAQGTDASNTSIYRNCLDAGGNYGPGCTDPNTGTPNPGNGTGKLFNVDNPSRSYRSGLGDMTFGIAWAAFNQNRDDTKPTWVLGFDYTAPTAGLNDPSVATSSDKHGGIGDKINRYKWYTSISKRIGFADPYFQLHYTLPWQGPGYYSNCDNANPTNMGRPGNCGQGPWDRSTTGIRPSHVGGFLFGTELNAFENPNMHQKIAFDIRGWVTYTSEGRYSNELSDLMGKQLYSSDYAQIGGWIGFTGHAAEFITLRAYASLAYNTEHFLTNENIGQDQNGNGTVDVTGNPIEVSPNYDWRVDRPGRRFRISEEAIFTVMATASFNF